jgi:subtilisin family serine protease
MSHLRRWSVAGLAALTLGPYLFTAPASAAAPEKADAAVIDATTAGKTADVYVMLRAKADLSGGKQLRAHADRTSYGYRALRDAAANSQQGLRGMLDGKHAKYTPFWIVNTVLVRGADRAMIDQLAGRADVARIRAAGSRKISMPTRANPVTAAADAPPEWGVARIRAPEVWSQLGARGDGVVVGSIDTGVEFDHPALYKQYRGRQSDGTYVHDYNWFDPSSICGSPAPCDNQGHGTHTMGTIVGDDGAGNRIGVAPGARWIAAKGCESSGCSDYALLSAGQWMIAPTDLTGNNPRPDLAPNIINNSWGGSGNDPFYSDIVNAWVQVGIFPAFANGNAGPSCGSAGAPGNYAASFGVGAFDVNNQIAPFSGRGASRIDGGIKPNITAPGVAVRSSVPGGRYDTYSGTSMATPHVSGAVALLWSAVPTLLGDIAGTEAALAAGAVDTADLTCGGTADDNNVWGEGRLDIFSTIALTPRGPTGVLTGAIGVNSGAPLPGARITARTSAGAQRSSTTDQSGNYSFILPPGTYQVSAAAFGYNPQVTQPGGGPLPATTVTLVGSPLPVAVTASDGSFGITDVPAGQYRLVTQPSRCAADADVAITVDGDEAVTIDAPPATDVFGYKCEVTGAAFVDAGTVLPLTGDDADAEVTLPFPVPLYGSTFTKAWVSTNGFLNYQRSNSLSINTSLPNTTFPNAGVYPFWDDLVVDGQASVRTALTGTAPDRQFVIEWRNVALYDAPATRLTFEAILAETGQIFLRYRSLPAAALARGASATVGIEDASGSRAFNYATNAPALRSNTSIRFHGLAVVQGVLTDIDGHPLAGQLVRLNYSLTTTTDAQGIYRFFVPPGSYQLSFNSSDYAYVSADVQVAAEGDVATANMRALSAHNVVTGVVRDDDGLPLAGVSVTLYGSGTSWQVKTDANGAYRITEVRPTYDNIDVSATCLQFTSTPVWIERDAVIDLVVPRDRDAFGHRCYPATYDWVPGTSQIALTGDAATAPVTLPFAFGFYGAPYTSAYVATKGVLNFVDSTPPTTAADLQRPPTTWKPNGALYPYWGDLVVDGQASVWTATTGTGADQRFIVEWRNVLYKGTDKRVTFEAQLFADGRIRYDYQAIPQDNVYTRGKDVGIGIENPTGRDGMALIWRSLSSRPGTAWEFRMHG